MLKSKNSLLFNQETLILTDIEISLKFAGAFEYTNFSIHIYQLRSIKASSNPEKPHEVRIYRFWALDESSFIPVESAYFMKMIQIINFSNPVFQKTDNRFAHIKNNNMYPRHKQEKATYLLHLE